jgi:hypothetical protein
MAMDTAVKPTPTLDYIPSQDRLPQLFQAIINDGWAYFRAVSLYPQLVYGLSTIDADNDWSDWDRQETACNVSVRVPEQHQV